MIGTIGDDNLVGSLAADDIDGLAGNDTLNGLAGDDTLRGGAGADQLNGGAGADLMMGGTGNDTYDVDSQYDVIVEGAGEGIDTVYTMSGYAMAVNIENVEVVDIRPGIGHRVYGNELGNVIGGNIGNDTLWAGSGDDLVIGQGGSDDLAGGAGNDTLVGGIGQDSLRPGLGFDVVDGGSLNDILYVDYRTLAGPITMDINNGVIDGGTSSAHFTGIESFNLIGGKGGDYLTGGGSRDTLDGGKGADTMQGGDNAGDIYYVDSRGDVVIELPSASGGDDSLFASVSYVIPAGVEQVFLRGTAFKLVGGSADQSLFGTDLDNQLLAGAGDDYLDGSDGDDALNGGAGDDHLVGGSADDTLTGGLGDDFLVGDEGADVFRFTSIQDSTGGPPTAPGDYGSFDDIAFFSQYESDLIDLSMIDADLNTAGNQAFQFVGTAFTGSAGEVRYSSYVVDVPGTGSDLTVRSIEADVDGDGVADFWVAIGAFAGGMDIDFVAGDFIL